MTFAGSRGRVESQLVPEAGYELDTFAISGFPRRLGFGLVRAIGQAVRAPFACSRILAQRRPDVVLGAGGYVAGPMVLAARVRGIPAALTEADAHLGLANRLAAPLARRVFLAYAIAGRDGTKYRVVGRPVPSSHLGADRAAGRLALGLPPEGPVLAVFGGLAGAQALNDFAVDTWGEAGPAILHIAGERDYEAVRARVRRADYVLLATTDRFGEALAVADLALSLKLAGKKATKLKPTTYRFKVTDKSSIHNFHLTGPGVNVKTVVSQTGTKTFTVTLKKGTYRFVCDPHASQMKGSFKVS